MLKNFRANQGASHGIIIMLLIVICCAMLSIFISVGSLTLWSENDINQGLDMTNLGHLRIVQIIQSIGTFIIPSIIGVWLFYGDSFRACFGRGRLTAPVVLIAVMVIVISAPLINWASFVNQNIPFPASFNYIKQWMAQKEQSAMEMTRTFLTFETASDFLVNAFIMAILPAIGEEWLFRGMIQPLTARITKKMSSAIIITAILFSAMHFQFLTFFPRMILGIVLGYLYFYGKSLWLPIIAHFCNNFMALMAYAYYLQGGKEGADPLAASSEAPSIVLSISSLALVVLGLYQLRRLRNQQ